MHFSSFGVALPETIMPFSPTPQRKHSQSGPISNPFDRLGDEILLHIFLYAKVQGDPVDGSYSWVSNPVPWKLSHICRRWRLFTRQTPRLWETLPVFGFWRHSIALIRSSLKLVDGYPARVQISFGPSNQGDKGVEEEDEGDGESGKCSGTLACQELVTAGTQIRTFVCRWLDLYWVEPILPLLHSPCLQNIETAEVSLNTWDRYAKNQNPLVLSVLFGWTPKLRHLYVTVPSPENGKEYPVHHIWPPSSPNLKTFACTGWSIFRALEAVTLQATSSFEELAVCLNRDNPASKHTTTHTLPPLPALKTIRIIDDRIHVPPADPKIITTLLFHEDERILSHLLIPSLEKFVLWRSAITKIPSGLSLPRLQHLDLRRTDIQTVLLQDILEVSPRIAHLYLKDRADLVSSFLHRINQTKGRFLSDLVLLYIDLRKGPVLSNERVKKVRTLAEYLARRPGFIELHLESSWDDEIISSFEDSEEDEGSYDEEDDDDDEDERPAFRDNAPESEIADRGDRSYQEVVEVLQPLAWLDGHVGYEASKASPPNLALFIFVLIIISATVV